ncbi:tetratricopeptide repeat protein [Lacinutrix sp. 5H-3-7-4]|uniref:tetratricopeptide repeat-containing sensor histidine kinase n=1 Tax=Lacinutrix sp. (strain 5H-3-7-4) TaxID=983544 RepID=UPI00020A3DDD|nr:tetratricopeptide repeat protein [Lacinutrix sp. 5H-3-7-4]AEH00600.1 putative signal transduction histidine kinase [Lacinutrix sp. 5H-3-7-4]
MIFKNLSHITFWIIVLVICCCTAQVVNSQEKETGFSVFADSIIKVNHKNFGDLEYAIYKNKNDTTKMRTLATKSQQQNYPQGQAFANIMLGNQYRNTSNFDKSKTLLNNALVISKENNLPEFEIVSLNMLGVIDRRQDNIKSALDYHQKALELAEKQTNKTKSIKKSIAVSHNSMGNIYLSLKQEDLALKEFIKSLTIEKAIKNKLGLAINHHNIGAIYEAKGDLKKALKSYQKSLAYNEEINSDIGRIICNNSIGGIYVKQEKPEEALKVIKPTIALAKEKQDQFYIASAYIRLGWAQNQLGQLDLAKKNITKGLQVAKKYDLKSFIAEANFQLSSVSEKKGNNALALKQYKEAVALDQSISNEKNTQYVNRLRFQYEAEKQTNQIKTLASEKMILEKRNETTFVVLFILLTAVAGLFFFYRHKQVKNEKQILTLEQDMLRSQMNPHFIFNSLNSIKLYIINNEKENAVYYLNKFSKLIRKILVASTEKEISLAEELETMNLYMNIENIRFSNQINYNYTVEENINIDVIKVPSLVLQPFLENALWHGLASKKDDKIINVDIIKRDPDYVIIEITDNGIGRNASSKIKKNKLLNRKSVGIHLTKKRLENFSKPFTTNYKLTIEDLYKDNITAGTKVTIHIPINEMFKLKTA